MMLIMMIINFSEIKKTGKKKGFQNLGVGEETKVFGWNIYQCQATYLVLVQFLWIVQTGKFTNHLCSA